MDCVVRAFESGLKWAGVPDRERERVVQSLPIPATIDDITSCGRRLGLTVLRGIGTVIPYGPALVCYRTGFGEQHHAEFSPNVEIFADKCIVLAVTGWEAKIHKPPQKEE
jgi:hypothetical protein